MTVVKPSFPKLRRGHPLAQGLVGAWPLYEGGGLTTNDLSGRGNNGTLNSGVSWSQGQSGICLSFDGSTGFVTIPFAIPATFTFSAWLFSKNLSGTHSFLSVSSLEWDSNGTHFEIFGPDGALNGVITLPLNSWYHVVITRAGDSVTNGLTVYCNGVLDVQKTTATWSLGSTTPITVGAYSNHSVQFWNGLIDAPTFWNRAFSPAEVAVLYEDSFQMFRPSRTLFKAGTVSNIATFTADSTFTAVSGSITTINGSSTLAPNSGSTTTITGNSSSTILAGSITSTTGNSSSNNNAGSTTSLTGNSTLSALAGSASTFNATSSLSVLSGSIYTINGDSSLVGKPQVTGSLYNLTGDSSLSGIAGSSNNPQGSSTLNPVSGSTFNISGSSSLSGISKDIFTINGNSSLTILSGSTSTLNGSSSLLNIPGSAYTIPGDSVLTGIGTHTVNSIFTINGDSTFTIISKQTFKGISQKSAISIRQNKTGIGIRQRKTGININDG